MPNHAETMAEELYRFAISDEGIAAARQQMAAYACVLAALVDAFPEQDPRRQVAETFLRGYLEAVAAGPEAALRCLVHEAGRSCDAELPGGPNDA